VRIATLVALVLVVLASPASAQRRLDLVVHQRVVGLIEPMGAEHSIRIGMRGPLGDPRELLFTGAHVEVGAVNYTSPIDSITGGYLEVSPIALLILRAELTATAMWPIGMDGAGYYDAESYSAANDLRAERGRHASGWNFLVSATLQGAVPIGPLRLLMVDELTLEHVTLGDADFHFDPRRDAVLAKQDWVLGNRAMLLLEANVEGSLLRFGAYHDLRSVPRSESLATQLGGMVALAVDAGPSVPEVMPFLRMGAYLDGARAGSFTLLGGVMLRYDVARLR